MGTLDPDYCTLDGDYCTLDPDYCTLDGDYCTLDPDYCTCCGNQCVGSWRSSPREATSLSRHARRRTCPPSGSVTLGCVTGSVAWKANPLAHATRHEAQLP
ncbi:MAG: hypothetical protein L0H79_12970 [Intrasporangium sp.]|uniref:hypothetical protein n=1 Tax=Intrasporangium sp. TaxID=1925024 RepID=UPI00264831E7|nr:hypothetical protein [Intrasporangium sp.]MDN5796653.1 hypothetical protein [Intrasporangium sp.]